MSDELWRLPAHELAAGYRAGRFDPVDALRSVLARAARENPRLNALVAANPEAEADARLSAERWKQGAALSPLDGVPYTAKDNIPVAGLPCTWGSRLYAGYVPERDELPVARLRQAGLVLLGKTNVPEFTLQGYTDNPLFGPTRNPWNAALTPGGSSGGAAACVAAGIGPLALGTDGGGSIRRPCAHTGLAGLKPTFGMVPRAHGLPEILPGMEVVGPIARSVRDIVAVMRLLAPADRGDWAHGMRPEDAAAGWIDAGGEDRPVDRARIAYWRAVPGDPVDTEVAEAVRAASALFTEMGHELAESDAPAWIGEFNREVWPVLSQAGLAAAVPEGRSERLTPALRDMLRAGQSLTAVALFKAQEKVRAMKAWLNQCFARFDYLLLPSAAALPWPADEAYPARIAGQPVGPRGHAVFTAFVNAAGLPAINLPAPVAPGALPVGFQLVGPPFADPALCRLALDYEKRHPWHRTWPPESTVASFLHEAQSTRHAPQRKT